MCKNAFEVRCWRIFWSNIAHQVIVVVASSGDTSKSAKSEQFLIYVLFIFFYIFSLMPIFSALCTLIHCTFNDLHASNISWSHTVQNVISWLVFNFYFAVNYWVYAVYKLDHPNRKCWILTRLQIIRIPKNFWVLINMFFGEF